MRVPPQDQQVEESLLGTLLLQHVDEAYEKLQPDNFYNPTHREIFRAMIQVVMDGDAVDILSVEQKLKKSGIEFESHTLPDLTKSSEGSYAIRQIEIIKELSLKRQLILFCNDIISEGYENTTDGYKLLQKAQEKIFGLETDDKDTLHDIHDTLQALTKHISEIQESGEPIGMKTGLDLDDILQGFQDSKLYVIGARPSMGKTALVMTMMRQISKAGKGTGIVSLETSHKSLGVRLASQVSDVPAEIINSGRMNESQMKAFMGACAELSSLNIYIDDGAGINAMELRSKCVKMKRKGCDIIFVDFLTLINAEGRTKHEEVGDIMKMCKQISKELDIPLVMLAQLSRKVEDRTNKRPQLSDLRESGSIEEDADAIMFLYRPEYYGVMEDESGSTAGVAEVIIAKNKDGRTGIKRQYFDKPTMTFKNLTQKDKTPF